MAHSSIRIKVRRRKVAHLAANSRKSTVSNNTIPNYGLYLEKILQNEWKNNKCPQPKCLIKYKKRIHNKARPLPNEKWPDKQYVVFERPTKRKKRNDFIVYLHNNKKMSRVAYMEFLVQHKLKRWEHKNPRPIPENNTYEDIFSAQYMIPWQKLRNEAEERIRDFVVSIYDKLDLIGRFKMANGEYKESVVAQIKDINGDGHKINELDSSSRLLNRAVKITDEMSKKYTNLVCIRIMDHKKIKGRIILPKSELQKAA